MYLFEFLVRFVVVHTRLQHKVGENLGGLEQYVQPILLSHLFFADCGGNCV